MRRIVAGRMTESKTTIPHYYLAMRVDVTRLAEVRQELSRTCGERVSYNDFIIAACARALREVPQVNCRWTGKGVEAFASIDIGLAVALDEGLVVPVVRRADTLTVSSIAAVTRDLVEKARTRRLTPEDYRGGSLTITNLGMYGVDFVIPIINLGQPAILGVGQVAEEPVVHLGALAVRTVTRLTIACDHRVVDGAMGARFLEQVRADLEQPERLPLG
jgi:pyruvate dehydrogenase E2 component (dihydrolipoamide acetyltransferase)